MKITLQVQSNIHFKNTFAKKTQNEIIRLRLGYNLPQRKAPEFCNLYKKKRFLEKENKCAFSAGLEYEETQRVNKDKSQHYKKSYLC